MATIYILMAILRLNNFMAGLGESRGGFKGPSASLNIAVYILHE
jgi:hypothetical protein